MIRESLDGGSRHAFMAITPAVAHGVAFQNRPTTSGSSVNASQNVGFTTPCWVKLVRQGGQFTGYYSTNGVNWIQVPSSAASDGSPNPQTISMSPSAYIGLALTSHESGVSCVAQFSDVTITGATGAWKIADIGVAQPGNEAQPMYVALQDSANKTAIVKHADPAATLLSTWTEWSIPLADFTGVNLKAIKKLSIGVGDRTNPQRGGSGRLYIDDIRVGSPILPIGLVAHYALENNTEDSSGNGHHGTAVGGPVYVAGPAGKGMAMQFDGTGSQYVDLGTFNPSAVTDKLSVCLWAKWNGLTTQWQGLIGKRDTWAANQMMWQIEANQTTGAVTFSREGVYPASGNPVLPIGEWANVAITFDGAIAKFYFNGQMTGQGAFSFGSDTEAAIQFGACQANGGNPFNGALDEIRLYDIVLTDAEIRTLAGK